MRIHYRNLLVLLVALCLLTSQIVSSSAIDVAAGCISANASRSGPDDEDDDEEDEGDDDDDDDEQGSSYADNKDDHDVTTELAEETLSR